MTDSRAPSSRSIRIEADGKMIEGDLIVPAGAVGMILFAHGSGSSRLSPRNRFVASFLQQGGLATLLIDLLTAAEESEDMYTGHLRFDIPFLAGRLITAMEWLKSDPSTANLLLGLFGSSTGAAAALIAAARWPDDVAAIVSRGGRADMAGEFLPQVKAPVLLIVGGRDTPVIDMNKWALERLTGEKRLDIVPGATHLFEEPGTLETVADLAREWFLRYFSKDIGPAGSLGA